MFLIDLYSRKVVGWSMADNMRTELVKNALEMACVNRNPDKDVLFHSDRGSQYASDEFRKILKDKGFKQSMSRKGNCWDNAVSESFFHSLKTEELYFNKFYNKNQAKSCIFEYIELKYNRKRSHSYLGYLSPYQFELKQLCA
jgi:putative transposase